MPSSRLQSELGAATQIPARAAPVLKGLLTVPPVLSTDSVYLADLLSWRSAQEQALRADDGWLAVIGLFWLEAGDNTLGSAPGSSVILPERLPAQLGMLTLRDDEVTLRVLPGHNVHVAGEPAREAVLSSDDFHPTLVQIEAVTFFIIRRGERLGVRMRDADSEARRTFTGRHWFAPTLEMRISARFTPHESQRTIEVETAIGTTITLANPGSVTFHLGGHTHQMEAFEGEENSLWFAFRDATSGKQAYGACRFLDAPLHDGMADLDFNKAVHPPCAFTPFATCPLPPRENILPVAIEAGERWPDGAETA